MLNDAKPATPSQSTATDAPANPNRRHAVMAVLAAGMLSPQLRAQAASTPAAATQATAEPAVAEEVPYVQTPPLLVRRMLQLAEVTRRDLIWDLGSGDGRIVIAAAKDFGARGVGYEIDPALIRESRERAHKAGVLARTQFVEKDLFTLAFSEPSVVTLYLLPEFNMKLRPLLLAQMRPGSRVVSHEWDMGDWKPDETLLFPSPEKPHGTNKQHTVMLWLIPAPVAGRWQVQVTLSKSSPGEALNLTLEQRYQTVSVTADRGRVLWAQLRGTTLALAWADGGARWLLRGEVNGDRWAGRIERIGQWSNSNDDGAGRFVAMRQRVG